MPTLPPRYSPFGTAPASGLLKPSAKQSDERRGSAHQRGYGVAWQRQREADLAAQPLCIAHKANGLVKAARVVDHIIPHRGDMRLFWNPRNRQNLCDDCHNEIKKIIEARWDAGQATEVDLHLDRPLLQFFGPPPGGRKILKGALAQTAHVQEKFCAHILARKAFSRAFFSGMHIRSADVPT